MRTVRDSDAVLIEEMLAPPAIEDARSSLEYWAGRRQTLPLYRRAARREADEMATRWRQRVRAAEQARFDASLPGRVLVALGLSRFWPTRPAVDARALLGMGWMLVPGQLKVAVWATAFAFVLLAGTFAALVVALVQ
jgi:hypothetical protein